MTNHLDWTHKSVDIPAGGLEREREAVEGERNAIAAELGLLGLAHLSARYRIVALAGNCYRLTGSLRGDVEQACIITLESVSSRVEAPFDVEFVPVLEARDSIEEESVLEGPDVEVLEHGDIPVGRIVFETLSAALDPYPRRPGAEFKWQDPHAAEPERSNPFAVLAKLREKG